MLDVRENNLVPILKLLNPKLDKPEPLIRVQAEAREEKQFKMQSSKCKVQNFRTGSYSRKQMLTWH